jgi:asparaginyl-tRNA synthetase
MQLIKKVFESSKVGTPVVLKGWVKFMRKSKNFTFLIMNDGSCQKDMQVVLDPSMPDYENVTKHGLGTSVTVSGEVIASEGKGQSIEVRAHKVEIIGTVTEDYPLQKKATSLEFLRENAHLRARTNAFGAVFRIRHTLSQATHQFFSEQGFYYIHTPIITGSDAEGAGEMFRLTTLDLKNPPKKDKGEIDFSKDYFARETYLSVSGQLEAECLALGLGRVYTFGPTFRSENSNTTRHLSEFWMIEPEAAFFELEDVAKLGSEYIQFLIAQALEKNIDELLFLQERFEPGLIEKLQKVVNSSFTKITYTDAVEVLKNAKKKFDYPVAWGTDLQTEHERYLCEEHFQGPVIVTDYPKAIKAFYMKENPDGKTVRAMDVLIPGVGEIIGGSQREDNLEKLSKRMDELGLKKEDYWWYLDLRRFGSVPHAGFGLGFERAVMYITGMTNIRDTIAFPRTPKSADF